MILFSLFSVIWCRNESYQSYRRVTTTLQHHMMRTARKSTSIGVRKDKNTEVKKTKRVDNSTLLFCFVSTSSHLSSFFTRCYFVSTTCTDDNNKHFLPLTPVTNFVFSSRSGRKLVEVSTSSFVLFFSHLSS
jgi:hypothetical protein